VTAPEGPDPALRRLLRWYPRAWRVRYGDEFVATVEDVLDGGTPTLRLRLSVAWAGLRERGHLVKREANVTTWALAGPIVALIFADLPLSLRTPLPPARVWLATSALDAELGFAALGGAAILASALLAAPVFGQFLRAGGWPRIRRRVGWAAAATVAVAAGGALAWTVLASGAETFDRLNASGDYFLGIAGTALLLAVAFGLWTRTAISTARHLGLSRRIRAAEKVLVAVGGAALYTVMSAGLCFNAAIQPAVPALLLCIAGIPAFALSATVNLRRAVRKGRRLWSTPGRA
jgi:hypothetical protein